jgi:hypothetical protein
LVTEVVQPSNVSHENVLTLSLKMDECEPLAPGGGRGKGEQGQQCAQDRGRDSQHKHNFPFCS